MQGDGRNMLPPYGLTRTYPNQPVAMGRLGRGHFNSAYLRSARSTASGR